MTTRRRGSSSKRGGGPDDVYVEPVVVVPGDSRQAVVVSAVLEGVRRYLVLIGPQSHPPVESLAIAVDMLAEVWSDGRWNAPVSVVEVRADIGPGESVEVLPYRLPPDAPYPPDLRELARDSLTSTRTPVVVRGPYVVPWTRLLSLVMIGHFAGAVRRVVVVTSDPERLADRAVARSNFYGWMSDATFEDLAWVAEPPSPSAPASETTPDDFDLMTASEVGRLVLELITRYDRSGISYLWVGPDDLLGHRVVMNRGPGEPARSASMAVWPPSNEAVDDEARNWDASRAWYSAEHARRAVVALREATDDHRRLADAFDDFSLHVRSVRPRDEQDARPTLALGVELAQALLNQGHPYVADWVALTSAELAGQVGASDLERELLRKAAIANEGMGLFETALALHRAALEVSGAAPSAWTERNLHISVATTTAAMMATHEPEGLFHYTLDTGDELLLREALGHLDEAARLITADPDGGTEWSRLAVPIHVWRLRDLLGEHEEAVAALGALLTEPRLAGHASLRRSAQIYRLAALHKVADADERWDDALAAALADDPGWEADRELVLLAFHADHQIAAGDHQGAFLTAYNSWLGQAALLDRASRVPQPGERHGGLLAIDPLARMSRAWMGLAKTDAPSAELRARFHRLVGCIELTKSQWLRRDVAGGRARTSELAPEMSTGIDERLLLATELMREETVSRRSAASRHLDMPALVDELGVDRVVSELLHDLPEGTGYLSFHGTSTSTFVLGYAHDDVVVLELSVTREEIDYAIAALQVGFSGTGLYTPIDPDHPFGLPSDRTDPLDRLVERLAPVIPLLVECPLVLVSAHGSWHNVPVHAYLLPPIWDAGGTPGLCYVPNLSIGRDLFARARRRPAPSVASLVGYTAAVREQPLFEASFLNVARVLGEEGLTVDGILGEEVTPDEVVSMADRSDLVHVLAHGSSAEPDAAVMSSGLALSKGARGDGLLSGHVLLGARLEGAHVTLQACSMGRLVAATGDELWGMARAAFAAGASGVLAPMWDVDLRSSTELIAGFYNRWLSGLPKAQAFTEAQRALYESSPSDPWRHFYHWAAFKLMGA